jgi:hypothetical protein
VLNAVVQLAQSNGVASDGTVSDSTYLQASYTDAAGAPLSPNITVGSGGQFPPTARGVKVTASGTVATVLPGFVGLAQVLVRNSAIATARPTSPPQQVTPVLPIAALASDVQTSLSQHTLYDLFASAHVVSGGQPPTLNLASVQAPSTDVLATDMQYWSDGQHEASWQFSPTQNVNVTLAGGAYFANIAAGLHDNVRRQGLLDSDNAAYALVFVPVYDTASSTSVHVTGVAEMKLLNANITASSAQGLFVAYAASARPSPSTFSGTDVGAVLVQLTS